MSRGSQSISAVGLCATCGHRREVRNTRGSVFWLCQRSRTDPAYPRYPRLPVLECAGYQAGGPPAHAQPSQAAAAGQPPIEAC